MSTESKHNPNITFRPPQAVNDRLRDAAIQLSEKAGRKVTVTEIILTCINSHLDKLVK